MQWAAENDHIVLTNDVLTNDLDFGAILAVTRGTRPSVVQVRGDLLSPHEIGNAVVRAIHQARQELLEGALISVDVVYARLRILPLKK
jgi:predicted nuclease of predicted toxin-antitoxin system